MIAALFSFDFSIADRLAKPDFGELRAVDRIVSVGPLKQSFRMMMPRTLRKVKPGAGKQMRMVHHHAPGAVNDSLGIERVDKLAPPASAPGITKMLSVTMRWIQVNPIRCQSERIAAAIREQVIASSWLNIWRTVLWRGSIGFQS